MRTVSAACAIGLSLFSVPAEASDFWCTSKIVAVGQDGSGGVWANLDQNNGSRYIFICDMRNDASYCQGMMSILLSTKGADRVVNFHIVGTASASSCATMPVDWTRDLAPVWMQMN